MVALSRVHHGTVALQGEPTEEHSWFPGFAWTIVCCGRCGCHLVLALRVPGILGFPPSYCSRHHSCAECAAQA